MKFLQNFFSAVGSFFSNSDSRAEGNALANNKRRRIDDEDDVVLINDDSPPKRQRFYKEHQPLSDITRRKLLLTSSATQTYPEVVVPKVSDRLRGVLSSKSENVCVVDDDGSRLSPSKFKNRYKAPKHIRSPNKKMLSTGCPTFVDLTASSTEKVEQSKKALRRIQSAMDTPHTPPGFSCLSQPNSEMSYGAYERLLGSVISASAKESMGTPPILKPKKNLVVVDISDDEDSQPEIPTVDLTSRERRLKHFDVTSRRSRAPVVSPNVITIDEEENTPARVRVDRVNSFQKNIEASRYTKPDMLSKGAIDHTKQVERFLQLKSQYEQKAKCEDESVTATLHELIEKRIQTHLKITESFLIEEEDEEDITTEKPVLTPQMMAKVQNAQNSSLNKNQVLVSKFKLDIRREDFLTLKNLNWLNDAIINFYMELIAERGGTEKKYPSAYAFSTFFFPGLKNGYDRVRRYTRKVDLFSKDIILVPIHLSVHWCMAKIDMKRKEIVYYDSMMSSNDQVLELLMNYLTSEHRDKKKTDFDANGWTTRNEKNIPRQHNGSDCGVFACCFAEYSARRSVFNFAQNDMPYMRNKMCFEILSGKLLL